MALRSFLAVIALLPLPALAAGAASTPPGSETTTSGGATRTQQQTTRKIERPRPGTPLKPRMIEAPGATLMMIPASYEPATGPF